MDLDYLKQFIVVNDPLQRNEAGKIRYSIGTVFLHADPPVVLSGPSIHLMLKMYYLQSINEKRQEEGASDLTLREEHEILAETVDLITRDHIVYIRPDPERMDLAFEADRFMQNGGIPKSQIRFLGTLNPEVRNAIKKAGECWRLQDIPRNREEIIELIKNSLIAIGTQTRYYYAPQTGIRYLTFDLFSSLERLSGMDLRACLVEIRDYSRRLNIFGNSEIAVFGAERFGADNFAGLDPAVLEDGDLRLAYSRLKKEFYEDVEPTLRFDHPGDPHWRAVMFKSLMRSPAEESETLPEEVQLGLSTEFHMQVAWLPSGQIVEDRVIPDPIEEEIREGRCDLRLHAMADSRVYGFIRNFLKEYGELEYVNVGRVENSLSRRPEMPGYRGVYLAVLKIPLMQREIVRFIRLQKRDIRFYLEEGLSLEEARERADRYRRGYLARYYACRRMGMRLPPISSNVRDDTYRGVPIKTSYFERPYAFGYATDKIPSAQYRESGFAALLAAELGRAAASNIAVGRVYEGRVIFDDGDEVIIPNEDGTVDLYVTEITATFRDCQTPLYAFAEAYMLPVFRRSEMVPDVREFADIYVREFVERFRSLQREYRENRQDFIDLAPIADDEELKSLWVQTLNRLEETDPDLLGDQMLGGALSGR